MSSANENSIKKLKQNNKRVLRAALVLPLLMLMLTTSGCSWLFGNEGFFRSRDNDYLKAEKMSSIEVPEGVAARPQTELYPIPPIDKASFEYAEEFEVPRPHAFSSDVYEETVKIQRLGEKRWIAINISPSEAWPRIRFFLNRNKISIDFTDASAGVIETAWIGFQADPDTRHKYRIEIEQGIQPDSAEIHIVQHNMDINAELPETLVWPELSTDRERETWMVDELSKELASDTGERNSASLLAQTIGSNDKVRIANRGQEPVLLLEIAVARARATLQHSLNEGGFNVWEQDEKSGIYYLRYIEPGEEPGFFARMFGKGSLKETPYSIFQLIEHMALEETSRNQVLFPRAAFQQDVESLKKAPGILAVVTESDNGMELTLRDAYGRTLAPREARRLLGIIRSNLI